MSSGHPGVSNQAEVGVPEEATSRMDHCVRLQFMEELMSRRGD